MSKGADRWRWGTLWIQVAAVAIFGLASSVGADGASFSCSKARTNDEKIICHFDDLSAADSAMGEALSLRLQNTPDVRAVQRRWIQARNARCDTENVSTPEETRVAKECLLAAIKHRTSELRASASASLNFEFTPLPPSAAAPTRPAQPSKTEQPAPSRQAASNLGLNRDPECFDDLSSYFKGCFVDFSASGRIWISQVKAAANFRVTHCDERDGGGECSFYILAGENVSASLSTTRELSVRSTLNFACLGDAACVLDTSGAKVSRLAIGCPNATPSSIARRVAIVEKCVIPGRKVSGPE
jgi:uncharacterized protein YecT (DUF1311 family)